MPEFLHQVTEYGCLEGTLRCRSTACAVAMQQSCQYQHPDPPRWCSELLVLVFTILLGCHLFWHLGAATAEHQFRLKLMLRLLQVAETRLVRMRDLEQGAEAAGIQAPPTQLCNRAGRESASMYDRVSTPPSIWQPALRLLEPLLSASPSATTR